MNNLVLHPSTKEQLLKYLARPSQALSIIAPKGSGKFTLAISIASELLGISIDKINSYAYYKLITPVDNKDISIDAIREIEHFISLRVPSKSLVHRVVLIKQADSMSTEAQTALLKTLEEPPKGTVFILTVSSEQSLLPTIRSRASKLVVFKPSQDQLIEYFSELGFASQTIKQAISLSGGLIGLTNAILSSSEDHPLSIAVTKAKQLLSGGIFERLTQVDELSKNKALTSDTLYIMQQMAQISLLHSNSLSEKKWAKILVASYNAQKELSNNAQSKLVLTNLMLEI
jgi:DNA polymerase-3 subunit delta'